MGKRCRKLLPHLLEGAGKWPTQGQEQSGVGRGEPDSAALGPHKLHRCPSQGSCRSRCWCGRWGTGGTGELGSLPSGGAPVTAHSFLTYTQKLFFPGYPTFMQLLRERLAFRPYAVLGSVITSMGSLLPGLELLIFLVF